MVLKSLYLVIIYQCAQFDLFLSWRNSKLCGWTKTDQIECADE